MPKSLKSRFKKYTYKTCNDLKELSGRDIIRLNPSTVSWDIMNTIRTCNPEQKYALEDYLMVLKEKKKTMTPEQYAIEVNEALQDFTNAIKGSSVASFIKTATKLSNEIKQRKSTKNGNGINRRRRRNTKKKKNYK